MDGIALKRPEGWQDRSMLAYSDPELPKSGVAPNIVVTKDDLSVISGSSDEERIKKFADKQVADMKAQLPSPVVHVQQTTTVDGKDAAEVLVSWQQGRVRLTQWVVFIHRDEEQAVIATATAAESEFSEHRNTFADLVYSITL